MANVIEVPSEIKQEIINIDNQILLLKVVDAETYLQAGETFGIIATMEKKIKAFFEPLCKKADEAHKALTSAKAAELAKLTPLRAHLSKEMTAWNIEQEKIRAAEEARLRAEAVKREEEERLQAALVAEKEGNKEEAEAILSEPVHVATPVIPINVPKTNGLAMRETWQFRVTDLKALIKAVADGKVPINAVIPNDTFLGQQARSLKGTVQYPGVEFYSVKNMTGVRR